MFGSTAKLLEVVADPAGASTRIGPVIAFVETDTKIVPLLSTFILLAKTPPNRTPSAPKKFFPVLITFVPVRPEPGVNPVIAGGPKKLVCDVFATNGAPTLIGPVLAPAGTSLFCC